MPQHPVPKRRRGGSKMKKSRKSRIKGFKRKRK